MIKGGSDAGSGSGIGGRRTTLGGSSKDFRFQYYKNLGIEDAVERPLEAMVSEGCTHVDNRARFMRQMRDLCSQMMPAKLRCRIWKMFLGYHDVYVENWDLVDQWRGDMFNDLVEADDCDMMEYGGRVSGALDEGVTTMVDQLDRVAADHALIEYCMKRFKRLYKLQKTVVEGFSAHEVGCAADETILSLKFAPNGPQDEEEEEEEDGDDKEQEDDDGSADTSIHSILHQFDSTHGTSALVNPFHSASSVGMSQSTTKVLGNTRRSSISRSTGTGRGGSPYRTGGMLVRQQQQSRREMDQKLSIARVFINLFLEDEWKKRALKAVPQVATPTPQSPTFVPNMDDVDDITPSPSETEPESPDSVMVSVKDLFKQNTRPIAASFWCWYLWLEKFVATTGSHSSISVSRLPHKTTIWHDTVHYMINEMNRLCMEHLPDVYNVLYASRLRSSGDSIEQQRQMLDDIFENWFGTAFTMFLPLGSATKILDCLLMNGVKLAIYIGLSYLSHMRRQLVQCRDTFANACAQLTRISKCDTESVISEALRLETMLHKRKGSRHSHTRFGSSDI